ncbi:MAG: rRNA maturation RNAse YbeY, partial [Candidatus Binataceae bacterium]
MPVELRCDTAGARGLSEKLAADSRRLLELAGLAHCELSLVMVDDEAIRGFNREFRSRDEATDVLSFPQLEAAEAAPLR